MATVLKSCEEWPKWRDPAKCLPVAGERVLVVDRWGEYHLATSRYDYWLYNQRENHDVVGWLPLPEAP